MSNNSANKKTHYAITGATGLVGAHLCLKLLEKKDFQIRVLYRARSVLGQIEKVFNYYHAEPQKLIAKLEFRETDFEDPEDLYEALSGVDKLFHCAAKVSFSAQDRQSLLYENPRLSAAVVNAALEQKVSKLIYVSSVAALGRAPKQEDFDENSHWTESKNNSDYAKGKYAAELEVWRGEEEGLSSVIVNPSIILGPGRWTQGSSAIFHQIAKGIPFYPPGVNGFVDVRDLVDIMTQLAESEIHGERFVVCAENWSYQKLFTRLAQELGQSPPRFVLKKWMLAIAWRFEAVRSALFSTPAFVTKSTTHTALHRYRYHSDKLQQKIAFQFRSLEDSIADFSAMYRRDYLRTK